MKHYSLRKNRRVLKNGFKIFQKKKHLLSESERNHLEAELRALDNAVISKKAQEATPHAHFVESFMKKRFPKTVWEQMREFVYALAFAIAVAFLIRQFWFELYEVPTGSMRPTVEELDRMIVSKTTFGLNLPFVKKPLFYSDDYIKRTGAIVFTVEDMDVPDADMLYFKVIPGKKRYIKRCVGKPGDTIYFYGGKIYAIDKEEKPLLLQADSDYLNRIGIEKIDHIPYIFMDGKSKMTKPVHSMPSLTLYQMNLPIGKFELKQNGEFEGLFYNGTEWLSDRIDALKAPHDQPMSYSDLWGIGNFAMARLLTKKQVKKFYDSAPEGEEGVVAYLELRHTPNLTYPPPQLRQNEMGMIVPMITPFVSIIPLKQNHLDHIQAALFTARFFIENGHAFRYNEGRHRPQRKEYDPLFQNVPNGCYEFYYGVGYKVLFGGITTQLPKNHPLYEASAENIIKLFNLGIGFNTVYEPVAANQPYNPQRFAYYRDGDLYIMGSPILKKNDPTLIRFLQNEAEKQKESTREKPYIAFVDSGPPLKEDGSLDIEFIKMFGLKIPKQSLVALGDNYAMSADSRDFGFVPTENLRGSPVMTFWPPGSRFGIFPQMRYPWMTLPNLLVWTLAIIILITTFIWIRYRNQNSLFKD